MHSLPRFRQRALRFCGARACRACKDSGSERAEPAPKEAAQPVEPSLLKSPRSELQAGALCTFLPTERTASRGVRGRIDGTDAVGTVSRASWAAHAQDLLGQVVLVRVDGKSRTGRRLSVSLVEAPDAPAEVPAAAPEQDSLPAGKRP